MQSGSEVLWRHWRLHKYLYILILPILLANIPEIANLVGDWLYDSNYSHGFLVIPVFIFLIWRKRKELLLPARPSRWGILLFGFGSFVYILGIASSEHFTTRVSMLMMIAGISLYYIGEANFKKVWFSFAFLIFMVPVPAVVYYSATFPMQLFASKVSEVFLHVLGVPLVRHGNILNLPGYSLEVVEACSGLRSLVSLLALSSLYGHLTLSGKIRPLILFLAAIPIAIATNILRLIFSAIAAYTISVEFAEGFLHEIAGIMVFAVAFIFIVIMGSILRWSEKRS
ncbi:MAG: exosortase/archaeosortase family protein [Candidatus Zixiibacteriota bacterium]|nr:MAG: exosortase/archaeosortase family protein [candidate division Zixibacteria bacterium]